MVGLLAVFGELLVEERDGDEEVIAVLVGDATGEVDCPEFEFSFGRVQPRIKASHKQQTKAQVKRCCLGFCTRNLFSCLDWSINITRKHRTLEFGREESHQTFKP